jgi:uncharacterized membrane protein
MSLIAFVRPMLAGLAAGSRSQSATTACALSPLTLTSGKSDRVLHGWLAKRVQVLAAAGEIVGDKLPQAPARTEVEALVPRLILGAGAAGMLARRHGNSVVLAGVLGAAAAAASSFGGVPLRAAAAARLGNDLPAAIGEDVLAYTVAFAATRMA